jgi:SlyX protein
MVVTPCAWLTLTNWCEVSVCGIVALPIAAQSLHPHTILRLLPIDRQAQAPYDVASRGAAKEDMMQALEEQIAHLTRTVEELSDVVAGQQDEITRLSTRVRMLIVREAGR